MSKPYIAVVRTYFNGKIKEYEFATIKLAQSFRETFDNWGIDTALVVNYDRKKLRSQASNSINEL